MNGGVGRIDRPGRNRGEWIDAVDIKLLLPGHWLASTSKIDGLGILLAASTANSPTDDAETLANFIALKTSASDDPSIRASGFAPSDTLSRTSCASFACKQRKAQQTPHWLSCVTNQRSRGQGGSR